jgi:hypothetical protein
MEINNENESYCDNSIVGSDEISESEKLYLNNLQELKKYRVENVKLKTKLNLVTRYLEFERNNMNELKSDLDSNIKKIMLDLSISTKEIIFKHNNEKDYLNRNITILKKENNILNISNNNEIQKYKEIELILNNNNNEKEILNDELLKLNETIYLFELQINDIDLKHNERIDCLNNIIIQKENDKNILNNKYNELMQEFSNYKSNSIDNKLNEKNINEISNLHFKNATLMKDYDNVVDEKNKIDNLLSNEILHKSDLMNENDDLKDKILKLNDLQNRLLLSNEQLQNDFNSILRREEALRNEIGSNNNNKNDLQGKLRSITEKVKNIEKDHHIEIEKLQIERDNACYSSERYSKLLKELELRCTHFETKLLTSDESNNNKIENVNKELEFNKEIIQTEKLKFDKLNEKNSLQLKEIKDLNDKLNELRNDRDEINNKLNILNDKSKSYDTDYKLVIKERDSIMSQLNSIKNDKEKMTNQLNDMILQQDNNQDSEKLNLLLIDKNNEISNLKDCVSRECMERTEMKIEMSEMKDKLLKLSNYSNSNKNNSSIMIGGEYPETDLQPFLSKLSSNKSIYSNNNDNKIEKSSSAGGETSASNAWTNRPKNKKKSTNR